MTLQNLRIPLLVPISPLLRRLAPSIRVPRVLKVLLVRDFHTAALPILFPLGVTSFQDLFLVEGFGFGAQDLLFDYGFERLFGDFFLDAAWVGVRAFAVAGAVCGA